MPKTTIGKGGLKFETAHILGVGYEGKCKNIHGHNYKVRVEMTAAELDRFGMVADFSLLKPVQQWLDEHFDHALLLNGYDLIHQELGAVLRDDFGLKVQFIDGNPTAEVLADVILDRARRILGGCVYAVTVWENDDAYARVTIDLEEDAHLYVDADMAREALHEEMAERKLGGGD